MRERRVLWVVLAAFVVGLVAVGGLAAVEKGESGGPPRLPALAASGAAGGAPAEAKMSTDAAMRMGPVEYRVAGALPALPDSAAAWDVGADVDAADVRRLATALGVDGEPEADDSGWAVTASDRVLRVERFAGAPWSLGPAATDCVAPDTPVSSDGVVSSGCGFAASGTATATAPPPATTTEACPMPDCPPDAACAQVCPTPQPVPMPEPERPADLPSKADAERIGRDFLATAGLDLDGAEVRVEDGFSQWMVAAEPVVGGLPTQGFGWSVSVGPKGAIQYANGWLADPTKGDEYPLAGVQAGIERLKTGTGGWSPYIARDMSMPVDGQPQIRTITGVRLGLMFSPVFRADGPAADALLVPSYFFRFDDSDYEQPVIAVADEFLPKPPDVEPQPEPMPVEPGGGTGGGSCVGAAEGAAAGQDNAPLTMQVCVDPTPAKVGQPVTFSVTASDPDAPIVDGQCEAGIRARFGDESLTSGCRTSCAAPAQQQEYAKEPGKFATQFTHTYTKAGTYTAVFTARSGRDCDQNPYASTGEVAVEVVVEP